MAEIDRQDVALSTFLQPEQIDTFELDIKDGIEAKEISKIWGKTEVKRYCFRLADNLGLLECNKNLADKISLSIKDTFDRYAIDNDTIEKINICITKPEKEYVVYLDDVDKLPRLTLFKRVFKFMKGEK